MKKPARAERKDRRRQTDSTLGRLLASPGKTALVLFVVAFLVYANTIGNEFVWDDLDLIVNNPVMGHLDVAEMGRLFTSNIWAGYQNAGYYRPAVALSFHVQHKVFRGNPAGFHGANVAWNAITGVLVFLFVYLLFRNAILGAVTALLFALHPLHTENVAWVSGRTDVLSTMWAMGSLVLYVVFRRRGGALILVAAFVAFFASLLAKESAAFVPLIVILLEAPPLRALLPAPASASRAAPVLRVAGFVAVLAAYAALRIRALDVAVTPYDRYADGALGTVALPLSILAGYVGKLVFPFRLNAEWDAPVPSSFASVHVVAGFLIALGVVAALVRYRRVPEVVLGTAIFALGIAPVLNVIPIGEVSAERFLYFPSLGFALVLAAIFAPALVAASPALADLPTMRGARRGAVSRGRGRELMWLLAIVLVAFAARTVTRNTVWKNEHALFTATVEAAPNSARAHVNLGDVAFRQGRIVDAISLYKRALAIDPDFTLALSNLAGVYGQQRRFDDAAPLIERAARNQPENPGLLSNLGSLYYEQGRFDDAAAAFERSLAIDPEQPTAHFNMGLIEFDRRNWTAARGHFLPVVGLGSGYHMAFYYLAVIESESNNRAAAQQYAERFLSVHTHNDEYRQRARSILSQP